MQVLEANPVKAEILVLEGNGDIVLHFSSTGEIKDTRCTARWNHYGSRETASVPKNLFCQARARAIAAIANARKKTCKEPAQEQLQLL